MLIKKVLVLTDGSQNSRSALRYAVELCRNFNASLHLLSVIEDMPSYATLEVGSEFISKVQEAIKSEVVNCSGYCETSGISCQGEIRHGVPYEEIVNYAKEIDVDLIVMATHGHTGLSHILLGSVAEKVVRHAPCPVMVTRIDNKDWDITKPGTCAV
ncbi:MAG: universal stress protein [Deltaproteobacteria bacterium]|nr:universal stress protein [Deltaproteobacteria bacterium]